jgi:hypothetical protein
MGTFAETAIVDNRISFADQGKQTFVFRFHLQQTNRSMSFSLCVCSKHTKISIFRLVRFPFAKFPKHGNMVT